MRIGTQIGYKTGSDILVRTGSLAIVIVSARLLSDTDFGVFSLAWTAGWILSVGTDFGLQLLMSREVARYRGSSWEIFRYFLRIRCWFAFAVLALVVLVCVTAQQPLNLMAFLMLVASQIGASLIEFLNYFYRGLSRSELESTVNLSHRLLGLGLVVAVLGVYPRLIALAVALFVATGLTLVASGLISRQFRVTGPVASQEPTWKGRSMGHVLPQLFPIGAGILFSALYFRIDLFFIELWKGTQSVAHYNAAFRLLEGMRLFPACVMAVVFPRLCLDSAMEDTGVDLHRVVWRGPGPDCGSGTLVGRHW